MGNLYFKKPSKEGKTQKHKPRKETIAFLLNYSKALRVTEYKEMKFEALLN